MPKDDRLSRIRATGIPKWRENAAVVARERATAVHPGVAFSRQP
jgi:hypothetical protein